MKISELRLIIENLKDDDNLLIATPTFDDFTGRRDGWLMCQAKFVRVGKQGLVIKRGEGI